MNNLYYLRNNPVMVMGVVETAIERDGYAEVGRIAALLPILLDERMLEMLLDKNLQYTFRQLVQQNNMYLANYNDRYLSLLNPFYRALSIMMDADTVKLNGAFVEPSTEKSFHLVNMEESGNGRMKRVIEATCRLLALTEKETNKELYELLKVSL